MEKAIIILDGVSEGKTLFDKVAKENGYWVWNLNHRNVLSMLAHKLGWNGERTKEYYQFVDDLEELAEKYFSSESWYITTMTEKFFNDEKASLLVIHNCSNYLSQKMQEEYQNCFNITIFNEDVVEENCEYCKVLNCNSDTYVDDILLTLDILTKDFVKKEEI